MMSENNTHIQITSMNKRKIIELLRKKPIDTILQIKDNNYILNKGDIHSKAIKTEIKKILKNKEN